MSQADKSQKDKKDGFEAQKVMVIKNNQGLDKIGLLRSSSMKSNKKESEALGVINLFEVIKKKKDYYKINVKNCDGKLRIYCFFDFSFKKKTNSKEIMKSGADEENILTNRTPRLSWSNC